MCWPHWPLMLSMSRTQMGQFIRVLSWSGWEMTMQQSQAMALCSSLALRNDVRKKSWIMQPQLEMVPTPPRPSDHQLLQQFGENFGCEAGVYKDVKVVRKKYTGVQRLGCRLVVVTMRAEEGHGQEESLQPRAPREMLQGETSLQQGGCLQPFSRWSPLALGCSSPCKVKLRVGRGGLCGNACCLRLCCTKHVIEIPTKVPRR